ncbi:hypothetical protein HDU99_000699 [Rhizoclosmatium hyalinum]|nr:hypothetical protein HDU99_000699 [Rhizoclosmatium hyalinum]
MKQAKQRKTQQTSILDFAKPGVRALDAYNKATKKPASSSSSQNRLETDDALFADEDLALQRALAMSAQEHERHQQRILSQIQKDPNANEACSNIRSNTDNRSSLGSRGSVCPEDTTSNAIAKASWVVGLKAPKENISTNKIFPVVPPRLATLYSSSAASSNNNNTDILRSFPPPPVPPQQIARKLPLSLVPPSTSTSSSSSILHHKQPQRVLSDLNILRPVRQLDRSDNELPGKRQRHQQFQPISLISEDDDMQKDQDDDAFQAPRAHLKPKHRSAAAPTSNKSNHPGNNDIFVQETQFPIDKTSRPSSSRHAYNTTPQKPASLHSKQKQLITTPSSEVSSPEILLAKPVRRNRLQINDPAKTPTSKATNGSASPLPLPRQQSPLSNSLYVPNTFIPDTLGADIDGSSQRSLGGTLGSGRNKNRFMSGLTFLEEGNEEEEEEEEGDQEFGKMDEEEEARLLKSPEARGGEGVGGKDKGKQRRDSTDGSSPIVMSSRKVGSAAAKVAFRVSSPTALKQKRKVIVLEEDDDDDFQPLGQKSCPICEKPFPISIIERHAANCFAKPVSSRRQSIYDEDEAEEDAFVARQATKNRMNSRGIISSVSNGVLSHRQSQQQHGKNQEFSKWTCDTIVDDFEDIDEEPQQAREDPYEIDDFEDDVGNNYGNEGSYYEGDGPICLDDDDDEDEGEEGNDVEDGDTGGEHAGTIPNSLSPLKGFVDLRKLKERGELGQFAGYYNQFETTKKPPKRGKGSRGGGSTLKQSQAPSQRSQYSRRGGRGGGGFSQRGGRRRKGGTAGGRRRGSSSRNAESLREQRQAPASAEYNYYGDCDPDVSGFAGANEMRWEGGRSVQL